MDTVIISSNPPFDSREIDQDIAHLKDQLMVATALNSSPAILAYLTKLVNIEAYEMTKMPLLSIANESVKAVIANKQGQIEAYRHLFSLAQNI